MNLPPPTTPKASLHPKKVMLCLWKGILYDELNQMFHSNKYCCHLDQLKSALNEKHLELVNRKLIIFHQDNANHLFPLFPWTPDKNCYNLAGRLRFIYHIHQTLHLWISIYFHLYKILLMENVSIPRKTAKGTCNSSLVKKIFFLMVKMEL